ncbi:MAG: hypothetical protein IPI45_09940 [Saprospiraceae bacterium]|nr:hypothetical protein [Saprospiraceae bacterium]MBK7738080.1 hypothetical protein [Saprospiraceae bacterium]MBK7913340.1 hypothetical protein [Saprospiraceae bacterium]
MANIQTVLICPQHWGLGHVTRTIPVINYFIEKNYRVILASSGAGSDLLRMEFPQHKVLELPDYGIRYPFNSMYLNIGYQMLQMHWAILREHFAIRKICKQEQIDLIVSDARLGAFQFGKRSIIIAHHLHFSLGFKFIEWCCDTWMKLFYDRFDQLWIPDVEGPVNLSGELAHLYRGKNRYFVGLLSRFKKLEREKIYDLTFMLSGPEPQRSFLESIILQQLKEVPYEKAILIRGTQNGPILDELVQKQNPNLIIKSLVKGVELNEIMCASKMLVCRSGYSTLLDLAVIQTRAILIPTPGQPEQEYLSEELMKKKLYYSVQQDALNLKEDIKQLDKFTCNLHIDEALSLEQRLDPLIKKIESNG